MFVFELVWILGDTFHVMTVIYIMEFLYYESNKVNETKSVIEDLFSSIIRMFCIIGERGRAQL